MAKSKQLRQLNTGIKRLAPKAMRGGSGSIKREPLAFVRDPADPLAGVKPGKTLEEKCTRELDAYGKAFRDAAKKEQEAREHTLTGYGAEYFVCVFADAKQATAFLAAAGYPEPDDCFVDGTIVAEGLGIKLPRALAPPPAPLKVKQDKRLIGLITRKW